MSVVAASFEALKTIVENEQCQRFRWPGETGRGVVVDLFTAAHIVRTHKHVNDDNKAKIERMVARDRASFMRIADFCLRA